MHTTDTYAREATALTAEASVSSLSWGAIVAGAFVACALSILLLALGAGLGFSVASPTPRPGISAHTAAIVIGVYLLATATLASAVGGYLAGRLRATWARVHTDEGYFRDTAHGFTAWALATLMTVSVLGFSGLAVVSAGTVGTSAGLSQGAAMAAAQPGGDPNAYFVDTLFRADPAAAPQPGQDAAASRAEVGRIVGRSVTRREDMSAADRTYVTQVIATRSGVSREEADKRLNETMNQARAAAEEARKSARDLSLWIAASLLMGAFAASLAAASAGQLRDRD
jgi:hypothetical protein